MTTNQPFGPVSRRSVLAGVAAVGAVGALAACGGTGTGTATTAQTSPVTVPASDVPVGGGMIYKDTQIVVTQPTAGNYKAFSAICTHQGCIVASVNASAITCECHGSIFSPTDGSVKQGPAVTALPAKKVTVSGSNLTVS